MKKFLSVLLVLSLVFALAACGSSAPAADAPAADAPAAEDPAANVPAGKKGTLEVWSPFTGADGAAFPDICDAYNKTNPDYTIVHRPMVAEDMYMKLQMAVSSGEGIPDIAMNHVERIPLFADEGRVVDLAPYLANSEVKAENYNPKAWEMTDLNGGHYGVPLDVHSYILWVNMDLYEKYGLHDLDDGVLTWDEFEATAEKIKGEVIPMGLSWHRCLFLGSYAQLGGTLSEDGTMPSFNNDIAKKVLEQYSGMVEKGYTQADGVDSWKEFLAGNVLYEPEGVWMYNAVHDSGLNIKAFDFPVFDANVKGNWTSSRQFTIPKKPEVDEERVYAALDFMKFVEDHAEDWSVAGLVPAAKTALSGERFKEMPQYFLASETDGLKIYNYKYYGSAVESLDKVLADMMFGKLSIEDGLRQAEAETRDAIEMG